MSSTPPPPPRPTHCVAACHDNGYAPDLDGLITQNFRDKLVLVPGFAETAADIHRLDLPRMHTADLFEREKLVYPRRASGASTPSPKFGATPAMATHELPFTGRGTPKPTFVAQPVLSFNPALVSVAPSTEETLGLIHSDSRYGNVSPFCRWVCVR